MAKRRLGKGIDALLQGRDLTQLERLDEEGASVSRVPIDRVRPNPNQPRKTFTEESLQELSRSIEERGILQPILAEAETDGTYLIIAGERRYRAAKLAGLTVVPVLSGEFTDEEKLEIALIENIQRENINPIEEALAYRELMDTAELTQGELAHRIGKSRPAVANTLRLLKLSSEMQRAVIAGDITPGHGRAILSLEEEDLRNRVFDRITGESMSVRQAEEFCSVVRETGRMPESVDTIEVPEKGKHRTGRGTERGTPAKSVEMVEIEQRLIERFGTRVFLSGTNNKGRIEITYLSMEDLERILEIIEE